MTKTRVAIFDMDKGYRERFADYLMSYKAAEIELAVFTNVSFFHEALEEETFHLVVLGNGYEEVLSKVEKKCVPVLVLTEYVPSYVRESSEMLEERVIYVSKYQSMDGITRQIQLMTDRKRENNKVQFVHDKLEVIGVFSPIRHEMQVLFSMLYAKNVARKDKVLYVNLLDFSGFSDIFGEPEYDIGDIVLQLREGNDKREYVRECIYESGMFSYIAPFINPENIQEFCSADVMQLLKWIRENTDFQVVVLDIGTNVKNLAGVLSFCTRVFCIHKRGYLFETQRKQFELYLERTSEHSLRERIEILELPGHINTICGGMSLLEQLDWSEFGDFVRSKI
ncbi:MAG: hypothetical protein IKU69_05545 [Roseburia sp.]|nr:hypothetical protein [Roseburia sp.]